ncbi:hypothetical protein FQN57_001937 [Myotisia sp. PD_48]|nr:hypothetical protein FQN57_001937 [Myotisia sp. PD_48]
MHEANGSAFRIATPTRWVAVVTHHTALRELQDADKNILSMQAAADDRNSTGHILSRCIHQNPCHIPIIRYHLTRRMSSILPRIANDYSRPFGDCLVTSAGWTGIQIHEFASKWVATSTNRSLVCDELADDPEYLECAWEMSKLISRAGLAIGLAPQFLKRPLAFLLVARRRAFRTLQSKLGPVFRERQKVMQEDGSKPHQPDDVIQWILEATPPGTSIRDLCAYILYIQFSALHTTTISLINAIFDLAAHPEAQIPIREEIRDTLNDCGGWTKNALAKMKLLGSSLKESQRLHPVTTGTMMRKAMKTCTLADGTLLRKGQLVIAPAWAINRSERIYNNPNEFDAFRFAKMSDTIGDPHRHRMSMPGEGFASFGSGKHAWCTTRSTSRHFKPQSHINWLWCLFSSTPEISLVSKSTSISSSLKYYFTGYCGGCSGTRLHKNLRRDELYEEFSNYKKIVPLDDVLPGIEKSIRPGLTLKENAKWGFVIYRCSYSNDELWKQYVRIINDTSNLMAQHHTKSVTTSAPGWLMSCRTLWLIQNILTPMPSYENDPDDHNRAVCYGTRYDMCLFADDICLESIEHMSFPVVKILDRWFGHLPLEKRGYAIHPEHDDGETDEDDEDVGWMYTELYEFQGFRKRKAQLVLLLWFWLEFWNCADVVAGAS